MTLEQETPKNRKQIGMTDKRNKIYIEDYVVSYLKQIASDTDKKCGLAGLFGSCREIGESREFYIYAAAFEEDGGDGPVVRRENVQKIMRKRAEAFEDYFFLGWCVIGQSCAGAVWEQFYRSRMDSLFGLPELLLTIDKESLDEHFYTYPTDMPKETEGYFIFYEQNERMQNFMVDAHWREDVVRACEPDDVAKSCREYYKEKKARKKRGRLAVASCAVFVILMMFALGSKVTQAFGEQNGATEVALLSEMAVEEMSVVTDSPDREELMEADFPALEVDFIEGEGVLPEQADVLKTDEITLQEDTAVSQSDKTEEHAGKEEKEEPPAKGQEDVVCATYIVNKGDTLYGICMSFYGDAALLEDICDLNGIEDMNNILCGQKILLPKQNM